MKCVLNTTSKSSLSVLLDLTSFDFEYKANPCREKTFHKKYCAMVFLEKHFQYRDQVSLVPTDFQGDSFCTHRF